MRTLITGGAGYIGSHAVLAALEAGLQPVVVDNLYSGFRKAVPEGVPFEQGSVLDSDFLDSVLSAYSIDSVMHFAAYLEVEESTREPLKYYENNVYGTLKLLQACQKAGTVRRFVFSSSCATYGNPESVPVNESCAQRPVSPYGASKLATEFLIRDFCAAPDPQMSCALLRYFNVAGADPKMRAGQSTPRATQLVKACAEAAHGKRDELTVFGTDYATVDGTCVRDYIHVSDLAEAHVSALAYLASAKPGSIEAFNLGYGTGFSVLQIIEAMKKASGQSFRVNFAPRRSGDAEAIFSDSSQALAKLQLKFRYDDLELICKTAFEWEKQRRY